MLLPVLGFMLVALAATLVTMIGAFIPIVRILDRMGFPKSHVALYYLPFLNLFFIWRLASNPWPKADAAGYREVFQ